MLSILQSPIGLIALVSTFTIGTVSLFVLRSKRKEKSFASVKNESRKPLLLYKKGKFIKPNLSKLNLTEANIRMNLVACHMYNLELINTIIVDENGQILVFPVQSEKSKTYIEGIALAA